jgi:hypothetical protein
VAADVAGAGARERGLTLFKRAVAMALKAVQLANMGFAALTFWRGAAKSGR